jgi:cell filamentation protein
MRDKYGAEHDKYCYHKTDVLINKLNIRDSELLAEAETAFSTQRYLEYTSNITDICQLDFHHFKSLHYHLFQDLFEWAGQIREVDISKGNTRFCNISRIEPEAEKLFGSIPELSTQPPSNLIPALADLFCELNILHPFREGNGRTLRFFFEELVFLLGFDIHWPNITQQEWIDANISGVSLDLTPLIEIFESAIRIEK